MEFRFIHAADIHLGGRFAGLALRSQEAAEILARATETALDNLVQTAIDEAAAFVIVAGDLYDGRWSDLRVGFAAARAFGRLDQAGIRTFLVKGNHDAESVVTDSARLPESVHVFGSAAPETVRLEELGVAVHGWSFPDRAARENMALRYPAAVPGAVNIGVLHTSLGGHPDHDSYAPCSEDDLARAGYDYWALGHIHQREIVRRGAPWIVYPGSLQGRSPREPGAKGAMVVDVRDGGVADIRFRACDAARFETLSLDVSEIEALEEIEPAARRAFAEAQDGAEGRPVIARIRLTGDSALDAALRAESRRGLLGRFNELALHVSDTLLVEKVELATRPPRGQTTVGFDPELDAMIDAAAADAALAEAMGEELDQLRRRAPAALEIAQDPEIWLQRARAALAAEPV